MPPLEKIEQWSEVYGVKLLQPISVEVVTSDDRVAMKHTGVFDFAVDGSDYEQARNKAEAIIVSMPAKLQAKMQSLRNDMDTVLTYLPATLVK